MNKAKRNLSFIFVALLATAFFVLQFFTGCSSSEHEAGESGKTYAVWFSYLEYEELCSGMSKKEFTEFAKECAANLSKAGFNTIYIQAVAFTDALYSSSVYPPSKHLPGGIATSAKGSSPRERDSGIHTGVGIGIGFGKGGWTRTGVEVSIGMEGRAGNYPEEEESSWAKASYDPLKILVTQMKKKNIRTEAWINPMRSVKEEELESLPDDFIVKKWAKQKKGRAFLHQGRWYLNPYYPEVLRLITKCVSELVQNYDIDGIHIDDYFYPSSLPEEIDAEEFEKERQKHPKLTLKQFRTVNVDAMVRQIYAAVKKANPELTFGISPSGNIQTCRNAMFADPAHWTKQGSVDYLAPQIYWGFLHPAKPFVQTLNEWKQITAGTNVKLIAGLAAYKTGSAQSTNNAEADEEWQNSSRILADQTLAAIKADYEGIACFRYASLFSPSPVNSSHAEKELAALEAIMKR